MSILNKWIDGLNIDQLRDELKSLHAKYDERGMAMRETGEMVRSLYMAKINVLTEALEQISFRAETYSHPDEREKLIQYCLDTSTEALAKVSAK